jgi:hypothetical protein
MPISMSSTTQRDSLMTPPGRSLRAYPSGLCTLDGAERAELPPTPEAIRPPGRSRVSPSRWESTALRSNLGSNAASGSPGSIRRIQRRALWSNPHGASSVGWRGSQRSAKLASVLGQTTTAPPSTQRYATPDRLDDSEWPGSLHEAIARGSKACRRKSKHEVRGARLKPIENEHGCHGNRAEQGYCVHLAVMSLSRRDVAVEQLCRNTEHCQNSEYDRQDWQ